MIHRVLTPIRALKVSACLGLGGPGAESKTTTDLELILTSVLLSLDRLDLGVHVGRATISAEYVSSTVHKIYPVKLSVQICTQRMLRKIVDLFALDTNELASQSCSFTTVYPKLGVYQHL